MTTATRARPLPTRVRKRRGREATPLDWALERVRLLADRRARWLHLLWQQSATGRAATDETPHAVRIAVQNLDDPVAERRWIARQPELEASTRTLAELEDRIEGDRTSRLAKLRSTLQMDRAEMDVLQACIAASLDPSLERVFAYLHDHPARSYPTEPLVSRLFGWGRALSWTAESGLRVFRIVAELDGPPAEPPPLRLDPHVFRWLQGIDELHPELVGIARLHPPGTPLREWPVDDVSERLERRAGDGEPPPTRVTIRGPEGSGRGTFASVVASRLGLPLLVLDADRVPEPDWDDVFLLAQRHAFLGSTALGWYGARALAPAWPTRTAIFPLQFVFTHSSGSPVELPGVLDEEISLTPPDRDERLRLWHRLVPASRVWQAGALDDLVSRQRLTIRDIESVGRRQPGTPREAELAVKEITRRRMGTLAEHLESQFVWDDLVVPRSVSDSLESLAFEARDRSLFWEQPAPQRLFPQGRGLIALFTGPPGTGKTMAAQVLTRDLGRELLRINLASILSKWVGETAKNIREICLRGRELDAALYFDEADTVFGRRVEIRDAQSRFANADTNVLLQEIESYPGLAILSTNRKSDIDPAFLRRLRYSIDFPKPDSALRRKLWERLVSELGGEGPAEAVGPLMDRVALRIEYTGAQIKHAVLSAVFAARRDGAPLNEKHLLDGIDQEYRKAGQSLTERDRKGLLGGR